MPDATVSNSDNWAPQRVLLASLVVGGVVLAFLLLYVYRAVLFLLFVAMVLATAIEPLVGWLERRGARHGAAVGGVYAILAVVLVGIVVTAGPLALDQVIEIATTLPTAYQDLREYLLNIPSAFVHRLALQLPTQAAAPAQPDEAVEQAVAQVSRTLGFVGTGLRGVLALAAAVLLAFYWSLQEERTVRWALLVFPPERREAARAFYEEAKAKVGGYVRGQGVLCLIVGGMSLVAYLLLGLPYPIVLAVLAGLLEAVPYFGPILGAVPAVLVAAVADPGKIVGVVVASIVIQQVENYLLVPRVMGKAVGVNPLVTLLAIAAFGSLFGIAGAILAIPLAAILQLVLDRYLFSPEAIAEPAELEGRDAVSVLRYQAQELIQDIRMRGRQKEAPVESGADRIEETIEAIAQDLDRGLAGESPGSDPANNRLNGREKT